MVQKFLLKVSRNSGPETVKFPKCDPFNRKFFLEIFENTGSIRYWTLPKVQTGRFD